MVRLVTLFNLLASAASLVGLYVTLQLGGSNYFMGGVFVVTLLLALYVLLVPGNPLERNVAAKIEHFRDTVNDQHIMVQRGTFSIRQTGPATIQFHQPFAELPKVEVLNLGRKAGDVPFVSKLTSVHAEFSRVSYGGSTPNTFAWIAQGRPLQPVKRG